MKKLVFLLFIFCLSPFLFADENITGSKDLQSAIPNENLALYHELSRTLKSDKNSFPIQNDDPLPKFVPGLFMAGSGFGVAKKDSQRWKELMACLDAFKNMKVDGVAIMISAPDIYIDKEHSLISFYRELANEIRSRKMKIYIEHFINPPFGKNVIKGFKDTVKGRQQFLETMKDELLQIYSEIKPDFLSLLTEPETLIRWTHLSYTENELVSWVEDVAQSLKKTGASPNTLLGAGGGTWESKIFFLELARQKGLDYIDFHLYALNLDRINQVEKLSELIDQIRKTRPKIIFTIGETWLYKHGKAEPKGMFCREAFFRDNFSFWSPLDQQFIELISGIAQKKKIAAIVPYFSQYFFSYYSFGDNESAKLPQWPISIMSSWKNANKSIQEKTLSPTGIRLKKLISDHQND